MPRFDGTGPMGEGPMTGRGMGRCRSDYGRSLGLGRGRGRGYAQANNADLQVKIERLEQELRTLKNQLIK